MVKVFLHSVLYRLYYTGCASETYLHRRRYCTTCSTCAGQLSHWLSFIVAHIATTPPSPFLLQHIQIWDGFAATNDDGKIVIVSFVDVHSKGSNVAMYKPRRITSSWKGKSDVHGCVCPRGEARLLNIGETTRNSGRYCSSFRYAGSSLCMCFCAS